MYRIRKKFRFEGSHILSNAYSEECMFHIHGHSYVVEVFIESEVLNETGMVCDFKYLKEVVKDIFEKWDHAFVVNNNDSRKYMKEVADIIVDFNPTAENMARHFFHSIRNAGIVPSKVRVHETESGYAEYEETL